MEIVVYILYTLIIFYLLYRVYKQRESIRRISSDHLQALMDLSLMKQELEKAMIQINNAKLEKDDGFVRFLSESRDWAYEYIATTQEVITKFNLEVEELLNSDIKPAQKLTKIKQLYKDLKQVLPSEDKNIKEK